MIAKGFFFLPVGRALTEVDVSVRLCRTHDVREFSIAAAVHLLISQATSNDIPPLLDLDDDGGGEGAAAASGAAPEMANHKHTR